MPTCGAPVSGGPAPAAPTRAPMPNVTVQLGAQSLAAKAICPSCGKQVPLTKFCCECGSPMEQACPTCGKDIPAGISGKFCPHCGGKL